MITKEAVVIFKELLNLIKDKFYISTYYANICNVYIYFGKKTNWFAYVLLIENEHQTGYTSSVGYPYFRVCANPCYNNSRIDWDKISKIFATRSISNELYMYIDNYSVALSDPEAFCKIMEFLIKLSKFKVL